MRARKAHYQIGSLSLNLKASELCHIKYHTHRVAQLPEANAFDAVRADVNDDLFIRAAERADIDGERAARATAELRGSSRHLCIDKMVWFPRRRPFR